MPNYITLHIIKRLTTLNESRLYSQTITKVLTSRLSFVQQHTDDKKKCCKKSHNELCFTDFIAQSRCKGHHGHWFMMLHMTSEWFTECQMMADWATNVAVLVCAINRMKRNITGSKRSN